MPVDQTSTRVEAPYHLGKTLSGRIREGFDRAGLTGAVVEDNGYDWHGLR